jgi:Poxvirus Late Transcription Factor VLTF3 like
MDIRSCYALYLEAKMSAPRPISELLRAPARSLGVDCACGVTPHVEDGFLTCPRCGLQCPDTPFDSAPPLGEPAPRVAKPYLRINHFKDWLLFSQGREQTPLPPTLLPVLHAEMEKEWCAPAEVTERRVHGWLKKNKRLGFNRLYEHIPRITALLSGRPSLHMRPELEEKLLWRFECVSRIFEAHKGHRKSCPSYAYLLRKMCLLEGDHAWAARFPLPKTTGILYEMDCFWRDICEALGWEFISSF